MRVKKHAIAFIAAPAVAGLVALAASCAPSGRGGGVASTSGGSGSQTFGTATQPIPNPPVTSTVTTTTTTTNTNNNTTNNTTGNNTGSSFPDPIRLDNFQGTPLTEQSNGDNLDFAFPSPQGLSTSLSISVPGNSTYTIGVLEVPADGMGDFERTASSGTGVNTVTFATNSNMGVTFTPKSSTAVKVEIGGLKSGDNVTISAKTSGTPLDTTKFTVFVHFCGDFTGYGQFNDLKATSDQQAFASAVVNVINSTYLNQAQIQIDTVNLGVGSVTTSTAGAATISGGGVNASLLDSSGKPVVSPNWGVLGVDASDATFGKALDIFVVQGVAPVTSRESGGPDDAPLEGSYSCGCTFVGAGQRNGICVSLFDASGKAIPQNTVALLLMHQIGRFLSLNLTTDPFSVLLGHDDMTDTPFFTDTNKDGALTVPADSPFPDQGNIMFPYPEDIISPGTLSQQQMAAMRAYLAFTSH